jgi:type IV pilus assembly protein PilC
MFQPVAATLNIEARAILFLQLLRMEKSGIPSVQAFSILQNINSKIHQNVQLLKKQLESGGSIAESGYRVGIFTATEKNLLLAGERSGNLESTYQQLADYYGLKAKRLNKLKSKLYLPAIVLLLALLIHPFPRLILNEITGVEYLLISLGKFICIALAIFIGLRLPNWLTVGYLRFLGLGNFIYQLQIKLPFVSNWVISRQLNEFFCALNMLLNAGIAASEALENATNTIKNPRLEEQLRPLCVATASGHSLAEAMAIVPIIDKKTKHTLLTGEQSGKLTETLSYIIKSQTEIIHYQEDSFVEWCPRILYLLIVAWMSSTL